MSSMTQEKIAIGGTANFFGQMAGNQNIDRILEPFGFGALEGNKTQKIGRALRTLYDNNNQNGIFAVISSLLKNHRLNDAEISNLNSLIKPLGLAIEKGALVQKEREDLLESIKEKPFTPEEKIMAEAYLILHRLENTLRVFISEKLKEKYGHNWWDNEIQSDIKQKCENRKKGEDDSPWHDVKNVGMIYYTTFKELEKIIQKHWGVFEPCFKDMRGAIGRLSELEIPRNTIAHNRILEEKEIQRLRIFSDDLIKCTK